MNAVDVFASIITVKDLVKSYTTLPSLVYTNKYFDHEINRYVVKDRFHQLPESSQFPIASLKVGECYWLTSARIDRTWFLLTAIHSETGEYIYDPEITEQVRRNLAV